MIQGSNARRYVSGFTIVEVMIVLAVTGALLAAVMLTIAGQQRRTEFTQSINEIDSKIRDIITNVSAGYYFNTNNFTCAVPIANGGPKFTLGANNQGQNPDCIFLGRAIQFAVNNDQTAFNIYNIAGERQYNGQDVTRIVDAKPAAIAYPNTVAGADATESGNLLYGLKAVRMYFTKAGVAQNINTVAFISTLPAYTGTNLNSGSQSAQLMPIASLPPPNIGTSDANNVASTAVTNIQGANFLDPPDGGVTICFQSGGTNQYGLINIGTNNRQLTTSLVVNDGVCP